MPSQISSELFQSMSRVITLAVKGTHRPREASTAQGTNTYMPSHGYPARQT